MIPMHNQLKQPARKLNYNLTYKEHISMVNKELAKRKDLIITDAHKGGAVIVNGSEFGTMSIKT